MVYSQEEKILIWLSSFEFLTISKAHNLLEYFKTPLQIFDAIVSKNQMAQKILSPHFELFFENAEKSYIDSFVNNLSKEDIVCSTMISSTYPEKLKEIYAYPINLYLKGDVSLLKSKALAIVGSRNPTNYGKSVTHDFSKALSRAGLTIVSGLAMGVDTIAHKATLEASGKTIAVLGAGFHKIYPAMNTNLANEIATKGLLVSEYAPSITPTKYQFPARNRIVAGLSEGVLLTEASDKSGSLITKEYAIEFNRNVYAVPGNITNSLSAGTNNLIKKNHALCVTSYKDILTDLGIEDNKEKKVIQMDINEQLIFSYVEKGEIHYDDLQNKCKLEPKMLNSYLTTMAIRGIIKKLPGNFYSK